MGNTRLGLLPRTHRWNQVIEKLSGSADLPEIAKASLKAAETGLLRLSGDAGFTTTLTAILKFVESAGSKDFGSALEQGGFHIPKEPSILDISSQLREKIDTELSRKRIKSDVSEIAQNSFTETLVRQVSSETPSLFGASPDALKSSLQKILSGVGFKAVMHDFFSTFTKRYLLYYLSRELPSHVGPRLRFNSLEAHNDFNQAFDLYVRQSIRIADEFTPGWFGKAKFEKKLTPDSVSRFAHVAFKKIVSEFTRGGKVPDG